MYYLFMIYYKKRGNTNNNKIDISDDTDYKIK